MSEAARNLIAHLARTHADPYIPEVHGDLDDAPEPLGTERLAEIAARAEAATSGPWHGEHLPDRGDCVVVGECGWVTPAPSSPEYDVLSEQGHADAEFIAHARADVPALLAEVKRMRADRNRYRSAWLSARERAQIDGREAAYWMPLARRRDEEASRLRGELAADSSRDEARCPEATGGLDADVARRERWEGAIEDVIFWYREATGSWPEDSGTTETLARRVASMARVVADAELAELRERQGETVGDLRPFPDSEAVCARCGHSGAEHQHAGDECWARLAKSHGDPIRLCSCRAFEVETGGAL